MRELILLRHAKAMSSSPDGSDVARPLSHRGEREARAAGEWLGKHHARPDRVLCSPAERTRATCTGVLTGLGPLPVRYEPDIYEATPGRLIALLDTHADADCALLIGHNPGLEQLVALLIQGTSSDYRGMRPAALAWIELDDELLEPGRGRLKAFWAP